MNRTTKIARLINQLKGDYYLNDLNQNELREQRNNDYSLPLIFGDNGDIIEFALIVPKKGVTVLSFNGIELPNCCGVMELGGFSVMSKKNCEFYKSETDCNILNDLVKFLDIIALSNYTIIINTIFSLEVLEEALALSKNWKLVCENVNPNSGNLIKTWINK